MSQPKRILLVDECAFMRRSIRRLLEVESDLRVCAEADAFEPVVRLLRARRPDLLISDLSGEGGDALAALRQIRREFPHLPILILTEREESLFAESALRAGADGYLMKRDAPEYLARAVSEVLNRCVFVSPAMQQVIFGRLRSIEKPPGRAPDVRHRVIRARASGPKVRSPAR